MWVNKEGEDVFVRDCVLGSEYLSVSMPLFSIPPHSTKNDEVTHLCNLDSERRCVCVYVCGPLYIYIY